MTKGLLPAASPWLLLPAPNGSRTLELQHMSGCAALATSLGSQSIDCNRKRMFRHWLLFRITYTLPMPPKDDRLQRQPALGRQCLPPTLDSTHLLQSHQLVAPCPAHTDPHPGAQVEMWFHKGLLYLYGQPHLHAFDDSHSNCIVHA
ncbi:hypothetical protein BAUCODRAFT_321946 [Baudoinia panamericana UAMH 10762]|uniref:Uncharacterized protein n=1 Tax=Baudoinia panamericana (strain UAMH 10762) TaxID=717646 RepID=M2M3Y8_BAUPA|nr:uncharacterized protein BAUCODRAFT_321946 [Baudoinia panamericana UAMH 10762]EMC91291.1 hypothetical protein BAUCODRAFT_321946 [Baudoinia panamericana UAMH 10762]